MCPTNSINYSSPGLVEPMPITRGYFDWISTACCTASLFYQHRIDKTYYLCDNCYLQAPPETHLLYTYKLRHYIHIGFGDCQEYCSVCNVLLATRSILHECRACISIFEGFLRYLEQSDDLPTDFTEATIVAISEDPVC